VAALLSRIFMVEGIPHAFTFAGLQGLLIFALAIPFTVIPLLALEQLGSAQAVSTFYLIIGIFSLSGALLLPMMLERWRRVRITLLGTACAIVSALLFPLESTLGLYVATVLYTFGFFAVDIVLNVVIMERIARQRFVRFEALRMCMLGLAFTVGPWLGVVIWSELGLWWPFAAMAVITVGVVAVCFARDFINDRQPSIRGHGNPLRFIPRFVRQPRVLLAYVLALIRSSWWNTVFVYAPIYCVANGYSDETAGLVVSMSAVFVVLAPLWGRLGAPLGMRRFLTLGYLATAIMAGIMTAFAGWPLAGIILILASCLCAAWLDAVGNAPFVRAVRPLERAEMTSLYTTYRDFGRIVPQGVFAVALIYLPVESVFALAGVGMLVGAWYSRHIPKRY